MRSGGNKGKWTCKSALESIGTNWELLDQAVTFSTLPTYLVVGVESAEEANIFSHRDNRTHTPDPGVGGGKGEDPVRTRTIWLLFFYHPHLLQMSLVVQPNL